MPSRFPLHKWTTSHRVILETTRLLTVEYYTSGKEYVGADEWSKRIALSP